MTSLLESYDAVAFTAVLDERLTAATARLAKVRGLSEEKAWLEAAVARLAEPRAPHLELLQKAARLPELEVVRSVQILGLQNLGVDAVERLQAGITFHTGSRMPLLDSLFDAGWKARRLERFDPAATNDSVIALFGETRAWKERVGYSDAAIAAVQEACAARPSAIVIQFGHPRLASRLTFARCVVSAWGGEAAMQSAAARWIMRAR